MSYEVLLTDNFKREAKRLIKKYRALRKELVELIDELEDDPIKGMLISESLYKIRVAVKSKGKGKRGGVRVIFFINELKKRVLLFSIYNKSEQESISLEKIKFLVRLVLAEEEEE